MMAKFAREYYYTICIEIVATFIKISFLPPQGKFKIQIQNAVQT